MDIHVPHKKLNQFKQVLRQASIVYLVKIRNLHRLMNLERMRLRSVPFDGAFHSYAKVCGYFSLNSDFFFLVYGDFSLLMEKKRNADHSNSSQDKSNNSDFFLKQ